MTCKKKFRCSSNIVVKQSLPGLLNGWIGLLYGLDYYMDWITIWIGLLYGSSGSYPELLKWLRKRLDVSELFEVKDIGVFLTTAFQQLVL